jgi:hypothetical protein
VKEMVNDVDDEKVMSSFVYQVKRIM